MSTRKSLFFSFLDRYAALAISMVASMFIARLLTPAEIGVFSVTMLLLMLLASVRDMGAGQYLVQERELTTDRIRAVWAVQLGLGVGLACLVLLASYPVALFYKEPRMRSIMMVVALNYAVNPFGSLTYAWLMREMRFENVALMRFASAISGALASIFLAWKGYGAISLAWGALASTIVNVATSIRFRPKSFPWLPGLREVRRVLAFGSKLSISSIVGVAAGGSSELFIGKLHSLTAAGLYSRSNGLVQMFNRLVIDAVNAVCLPWFAKQSRESGDFVAPFLKATSYVTVLGWSFSAGIACLAHPVVRVLYGNQWDKSVDLVRYLALSVACAAPASLCFMALLAIGAVTAITRLTILNAVLTVVFAALGAWQGLVPLAYAAIAAAAAGAFNGLQMTFKQLGISWHQILTPLRISAQVTVLAAIGPLVALLVYGPYPEQHAMPLVIGVVGGALGFVVGIFVFKHPMEAELASVWLQIKQKTALIF